MANRVSSSSSGRQAALARRQALSSQGKSGSASSVRSVSAPRRSVEPVRAAPARPVLTPSRAAPAAAAAPARKRAVAIDRGGRAQARARRAALSRSGKRANKSTDRTRQAPVAAPKVQESKASSGCQCSARPAAETARPQRSTPVTRSHALGGATPDRRRTAVRRTTPNVQPTGRLQSQARRAALSTRGKSAGVGAVSAATLARQANPGLTSRALARNVRAQRSQGGAVGVRRAAPAGRVRPGRAGPAQDQPWKVGLSETAAGQAVTGTRVGRSQSVTGDDSGTCRTVTGTEYLGAEIFHEFCQSEPLPRPEKVQVTRTGHGNRVTGNELGRSSRVTGNEPGSCRRVTGNEYVGREQHEAFCGTTLEPTQPPKVGQGTTRRGLMVSGSLPGRSQQVTGDEPGTCQAVTGTAYLGVEDIAAYCPPEAREQIEQRTSLGAQPGQPDYPQELQSGSWEGFSVASPARQVMRDRTVGVTGTRYEQQGGRVTGPFEMAAHKVTGTDQVRHAGRQAAVPLDVPVAESRVLEFEPDPEQPSGSRITGEGQSSGAKVTGDDWERGDRVTGTEGRSARRRNPTRPGLMTAMPPIVPKRNEELPTPVSRVTGSSGNTEKGSLVTYSGGARG